MKIVKAYLSQPLLLHLLESDDSADSAHLDTIQSRHLLDRESLLHNPAPDRLAQLLGCDRLGDKVWILREWTQVGTAGFWDGAILARASCATQLTISAVSAKVVGVRSWQSLSQLRSRAIEPLEHVAALEGASLICRCA